MIPEARLQDHARELTTGIAFLTRLPFTRATPATGGDVAKAVWAFPIAGVLVGLIGSLVYVLAHRFGLPPWPAAALAVIATMAATGCLHEDGLADTADGFGGGDTRERKLDIMRDSRIGTYGVCALAMSILLRVSALASLADPGLVVPALLAAHGAARAALPVFMLAMPPARRDGLAFSVGAPSRASVAVAGALGILILAICLGVAWGIAALILLLIAIALLAWLSLVQIEGQTGDVLGTLEQVCEVVVLLVALH